MYTPSFSLVSMYVERTLISDLQSDIFQLILIWCLWLRNITNREICEHAFEILQPRTREKKVESGVKKSKSNQLPLWRIFFMIYCHILLLQVSWLRLLASELSLLNPFCHSPHFCSILELWIFHSMYTHFTWFHSHVPFITVHKIIKFECSYPFYHFEATP